MSEVDILSFTDSEKEELQLLEDIVEECPSMKEELFKNTNLGHHFNNLKQKKLITDMSVSERAGFEITKALSAAITAQIDADIIKLLMGTCPTTATDPFEIKQLEKLAGITNSGVPLRSDIRRI